MSNMTLTPTEIQNAVTALEETLIGQEAQIFWAPLGAVVLTEDAVYEIFLNAGEVNIQQATLERARGWEDVTSEVTLELAE